MNRYFRRLQKFAKGGARGADHQDVRASPARPSEPTGRKRWRERQAWSAFSARRSQGEMVNTEREIYDASTPQDVTSTRAKSQLKGKVSADKWNQ